MYADGMIYAHGENGTVGLIEPSPEGLKVVSTFKVTHGSDEHWARPVIANGRLYIRHGNAMMAYEIKSDSPAATTTDGAGVWPQYPSKQFANDHKGGPSCTPALDLDRGAGRVWFLSRVGQLVCLSAAEGEELWTKSLTEELGAKVPPWGFSGSPFVDLQAVYLDVGRIVAFDRSSGRLLWQTKDYRTAYAT